MNAYAQSVDTYLAQRVLTAGPEQQAALLMEAGQRHLGKAIKAIEQKDYVEQARCLGRVSEIILESTTRLNFEGGGELALNLAKIYDWWTREIFEAGTTRNVARLNVLSHHMGQIRQGWEQLHEKQAKTTPFTEAHVGDRVV